MIGKLKPALSQVTDIAVPLTMGIKLKYQKMLTFTMFDDVNEAALS